MSGVPYTRCARRKGRRRHRYREGCGNREAVRILAFVMHASIIAPNARRDSQDVLYRFGHSHGERSL